MAMAMAVRALALSALALALTAAVAVAHRFDTRYAGARDDTPDSVALGVGDDYETISGPTSPANFSDWYAAWSAWRTGELARVKYNDTLYTLPVLQWTQSSFVQPQVMVHDRYLFDRRNDRYTVERVVDDAIARYGFMDSVLLWHSYPNIGVDDRSEFAMFTSLPGGTERTRKDLVDAFHRRGVKVLFPYNGAWDQGTAPFAPGQSDAQILAALWAAVEADGFNGDTMSGIPSDFWTASVAAGRPLALEPEVGLPSEDLAYDVMGWGYWPYAYVPVISRYKWLEQRFQVNVCNRWALNHTDDLQHAYFNGVGFESWENIWGIWNGLTNRTTQVIRRAYTVLHFFQNAVAGAQGNGAPREWIPHAPVVTTAFNRDVFASYFADTDVPGGALYLIVNRDDEGVNWPPATPPATAADSEPVVVLPCNATDRIFDVYFGTELTAANPCAADGTVALPLSIEALGYGGVYVLPGGVEPSQAFTTFLSAMSAMTATPLADYPDVNAILTQRLVPDAEVLPPERRPAFHPAVASASSAMVTFPSNNAWLFNVSGVEVEGPAGYPVDVQYPWETAPTRSHLLTIPVVSFALDVYPVTNRDFELFLDATHYAPRNDENFLQHWVTYPNGTWSYPNGFAAKPVVWIDRADAIAYCHASGKRLPREWEWSFAAQYDPATATANRQYPWGDAYDPSVVPPPCTSRVMCAPADVDAYPQGASAAGVMDLVGNVWQWTDEYEDERTAAAVLRGGSAYHPQGSQWYFPQAYSNWEHGKLLLMAPSMDRSAGIGFRCALDA